MQVRNILQFSLKYYEKSFFLREKAPFLMKKEFNFMKFAFNLYFYLCDVLYSKVYLFVV